MPDSSEIRSLQDRLSARRAARARNSDEVQAFLEAAAVLVDFDPDELKPARPVFDSDVRSALFGVSGVLVSNGAVRWRLNPDTRRSVLATLFQSGTLSEALSANASPTPSPEQRVFQDILTGRWDYARFTGERSLAAALEAAEWLRGTSENIPNPEELRQRLNYARFISPFERLAGDFFGRTAQLTKLHDYVGTQELRSSRETIVMNLRGWLLKEKRGPLLVYGPGGSGKSALIGKFILDQDAARLAFGQYPIVYLDFDNSSLRVEYPETLAKEAFRQVGLQYPQTSEMREQFVNEYDQLFGHLDASSELPASPDLIAPQPSVFRDAPAQARDPVAQARDEHQRARHFQEALPFVTRWMTRLSQIRSDLGAPFLVFFDTFEEAITRNRLAVAQILTLCEELQKAYPNVRPIIAGRAIETSFGDEIRRVFDQVALPDFDEGSAGAYLAKQGVTDPELARTIFNQLGGAPLTLKLAAVAISRGVEVSRKTGFVNLEKASWWNPVAASETWIQGQLYQRILAHIRNPQAPEVRKLANPGLVLRRVTPELISEALAGPCKLNLPSDPRQRRDAALMLFEALRRETFLVDPRGVNSLRHRTDIRRVMLRMLEKNDREDLVPSIHRAVVDYYTKHGTTAEDRAEEIYHRLKLGEDPAQVAQRWIAEVEQFLGDAVPELSPRAQRFLASRLGLKLKDEENIYKEAETEEWELFTVRRVNEAISAKRGADEILRFLRERADRTPSSPLFQLEGSLLRDAGRLAEAAAVLERGIRSAAGAADPHLVYLLLSDLAPTRVLAGDLEAAEQAYNQAAELARQANDRRLLLITLVNQYNVGARLERRQELLPDIASLLVAASDDELRALRTALPGLLSTPGSAQGPMLLRCIQAGVFDDTLRNPSGLPRVKQLLSVLFAHSTTDPATVQAAAGLLLGTAG